MSSTTISFAKLRGRDNYAVWKLHMRSYLVIKGLWDCTKTEITQSSTSNEKEKDLKALSEIILWIDPSIFSYIDGKDTAKEAWDALEKTLSESGLSRKVALLKQFTQTKLGDFENMEKYVHEMLSLSSRIKSTGLKLDDEIIASLMLAGLPSEFDPFVLAIENTQKTLTVEYVKTTLMQESRLDTKSNDSVLFAKKKQFTCHTCKSPGHFAKNCPQKKKGFNKKSKNKNETVLLTSLHVKNKPKVNDWCVDSGATSHMTNNCDGLVNKIAISDKEVLSADSSLLRVDCAGDINMLLENGKEQTKALLKNVAFVPDLCTNLLSVSQMTLKGNKIVFEGKSCKIFDRNSEQIATASLVDGLYRLNCEILIDEPMRKRKTEKALIVCKNRELWHRRLGHICDANLNNVKDAADGINFSSKKCEKCIVCVKGKQTRASFNSIGHRAENILDLVHSDVCEFETRSHSGARYILTFVDDYSRKVFVFPIKSKSQVYEEFLKFIALVENQCSRKIKILRTDNGTEYVNNKMLSFFESRGIKNELTVPDTPEQNGVAERMNRNLCDRIRCMLSDANLDKQFWAEAAVTAGYLINRVPTRGLKETPEERWSKVKPDLSHLRVFGCLAMVQVPNRKRKKVDMKSTECIHMGYSSQSKAWRLYNPATKKIVISHSVTFFEDKQKVICGGIKDANPFLSSIEIPFEEEQCVDSGEEDVVEAVMPLELNESSTSPVGDESNDGNQLDASQSQTNATIHLDTSGETYDDDFHDATYVPDESTELLGEVKKSIRIAAMEKPNYRPPDYSLKVTTRSATTRSMKDPSSYDEATSSSIASVWKQAMKSEYESLMSNGTWELVDLPEGKKPINNKWVYKTKVDANGKVEKHKARLVIKGYSQIEGIDYKQTFAPVVRYTSIRYLIATAAKLDLNITQMDAVTAFLNGDLEEEIFMRQPKGFEDGSKKVCKLKKSLYGLKQSSRVWNQRLNKTLLDFGLKRSLVDQCVYYIMNGPKILIVAIYVDDLMIFSNDTEAETRLKEKLCDSFEMKDLGEAHSILGVRITRDREEGSITIDQTHYIIEVLKRFGMVDCTAVSTPLDPNQQISASMSPTKVNEIEDMKGIPYMQAIGSLLFAAQITRPDISYGVNLLSRFASNPGKPHWSAVKRILRYLKGTSHRVLVYKKNDSEIVAYSDADYAGNFDTRQSTTGYVFLFQDAAISWASKSQKRPGLSTTESEYMAMVGAGKEWLWLRQLQLELFPAAQRLLVLHGDNKSAIDVVNNNSYSDNLKHVDVKTKFLHKMVQEGELELTYVPTNEMIADALTKALPKEKLQYHSSKFGLTN